VLTPAWLAGEWVDAFPVVNLIATRALQEGLLMTAITYFTACSRDRDDAARRALMWIGGIAFLPCAILLAIESGITHGLDRHGWNGLALMGSVLAIVLPLALACYLRRAAAWMNAIAAGWVILLGLIAMKETIGLYGWCVAGAAGMVAWGVKEGRGERVNMGMAGFAITLLCFYFSQLMDKMGRSESLIGLGLVFLGGGWVLEKFRRRFVAQARDVR
jgi:hypothetical protein